MNVTELVDTDLEVGRIVFGTMTFGGQVSEEDATVMVERCREAGVTMFDTSNNYNGGMAEEVLGRIVAPFRDEVQIATKVGSHVDQADKSVAGLTRASILTAVEASLRRLGTDHIDIYYFHRPDWSTPIEESLAAADELVRSGKVRMIAQSNFAAWQITNALGLAERNDWPQMRVSQPMYNLVARRIETEYAACSRHFDLFNIVYNPLAGGLLTGKHTLQAAPEPGTRFSKEMYRDRYWNEELFAGVQQLGRVASDAGLTLIELAYKWLLSQPLVDCMLMGASSIEQLDMNLASATESVLDQDTLDACDEVWNRLKGASPDYNR